MRKPWARSERAISASVPSPARKPGTSSTGSPRREPVRSAYGVLAAAPAVSGRAQREAADLDDGAALAQDRAGRGGGEALREQEVGQALVRM